MELATPVLAPAAKPPSGVVSSDGRWFVETVNGEQRRFELRVLEPLAEPTAGR